jgi:hypothetical protein
MVATIMMYGPKVGHEVLVALDVAYNTALKAAE